jgi:DnaK suppressor protein
MMKRNDFIQKMQQRLLVRRDALRRVLSGDVNALQSLGDSAVGDEGDLSVFGAQAEINSQMAQVESRELNQIEQALERMTDGRYGRCDSCNKAINTLRLQAVPYATECINCARKAERAMERDGMASRWDRLPTRDDEPEATVEDVESEIA